jgi:hypothetical protein
MMRSCKCFPFRSKMSTLSGIIWLQIKKWKSCYNIKMLTRLWEKYVIFIELCMKGDPFYLCLKGNNSY